MKKMYELPDMKEKAVEGAELLLKKNVINMRFGDKGDGVGFSASKYLLLRSIINGYSPIDGADLWNIIDCIIYDFLLQLGHHSIVKGSPAWDVLIRMVMMEIVLSNTPQDRCLVWSKIFKDLASTIVYDMKKEG